MWGDCKDSKAGQKKEGLYTIKWTGGFKFGDFVSERRRDLFPCIYTHYRDELRLEPAG
jgi:hypothetical protein